MKTNHKQTYNYVSTFTPLLRHVTTRNLAVAMFVALALLGTMRGSETEKMAPASSTAKAGRLSQSSLVVFRPRMHTMTATCLTMHIARTQFTGLTESYLRMWKITSRTAMKFPRS
jgi:hypothetical protein